MIVLDTNVVSEAMRPGPDPNVTRWLNANAADTLYLSSVTLADLLFGVGALAAADSRRLSRRDRSGARLRYRHQERQTFRRHCIDLIDPWQDPASRTP